MLSEQVLEHKAGRAQLEFFERLNALVIALIKRGRGSPGPLPTGLVLLETTGRKSGKTYPVPVVAAKLTDDFLLVGTVRKRSQWIRNLAAADTVTFWLAGEKRQAQVRVFEPGSARRSDTSGLPWRIALLVTAITAVAGSFGGSFVLLRTATAELQ